MALFVGVQIFGFKLRENERGKKRIVGAILCTRKRQEKYWVFCFAAEAEKFVFNILQKMDDL